MNGGCKSVSNLFFEAKLWNTSSVKERTGPVLVKSWLGNSKLDGFANEPKTATHFENQLIIFDWI